MHRDHYDYEEDGTYCYLGTDVLRNKLNIHDKDTLSEAERSISVEDDGAGRKTNQRPLRSGSPQGNPQGPFRGHLRLGRELRTVDISKGTMFCKCEYIKDNVIKLLKQLKDENYLLELDLDSMVSRLSYYLCEINAIHPFREGNGRTQRLFVKQLALDADYHLDFTGITDEEMIVASVRGFVLDYSPMENLVRRGLTKL